VTDRIVAISQEDLEFESEFKETTSCDRKAIAMSSGVKCNDVIEDEIHRSFLTPYAMTELSQFMASNVAFFGNENVKTRNSFEFRLTEESHDFINSQVFRMEQLLCDAGEIGRYTTLMNPSDVFMIMVLNRGWVGDVIVTANSKEQYHTRARELQVVSRYCGRGRLSIIELHSLMLSNDIYCGVHGVHRLTPNGFAFEINPYHTDTNLTCLSYVSDHEKGEPGYTLRYGRGGYRFMRHYSFTPLYYRYPWSSYSVWLGAECEDVVAAGLLFFCSQRELLFSYSRVATSSPRIDVQFLPIVPEYRSVEAIGGNLLISFDSDCVYDIKVPCTYTSKLWKLKMIAAKLSKTIVQVERAFFCDRDGLFAMPDIAEFVPATKKEIVGKQSCFLSFGLRAATDLCDDSPEIVYDPVSQVDHVTRDRNGDRRCEIVVPEQLACGVVDVGAMVPLPEISWSVVCDGKSGEFLSVVVECPVSVPRRDEDDNGDSSEFGYYRVFKGRKRGALQSTSGSTYLVDRDVHHRERCGDTLPEWLNLVFYGWFRSARNCFSYSPSRLKKVKTDVSRESWTGNGVLAARRKVRHLDHFG